MAKPVEQLSQVIVRFAGDSGDGMQLTGSQFTSETALLGNDISTLPDFPAEIRAPAGSLPGVSGFQLRFADHDILTPGDAPNVLVAMNPAALKTNLADLPNGGTLIVDADAFTERNLQKADYAQSPLEDGSLDEYQVHGVPLTSLTVGALKEIEGVTPREAERSKNMFALGLMSWLYGRSIKPTIEFLEEKFGAKRPEIAAANIKAIRAGYAFGETTESFAVTYEVKPAQLEPGTYRNITGNQALSLGLVAASRLSELPLFLGAYPITPASSILEELAGYKHFGVRTFQAEDEIAAAGAAVGAAFGGALGVTTSAGPGIVLKAETVGLAIMLELPLLICDIQRAGPPTGMPTKPEQGDLLPGLRAQKVAGIAADIPELEVDDPHGEAKVLVLSWGGTYGPVAAAARRVRGNGKHVAHAHLRHVNPFPRNSGEVLRRYDKVLVPEMNLGQLLQLVRSQVLVDAIGYNQVRGFPLRAAGVADAAEALVDG